ncbi:hypothetical protein BST27_29900 [Mycobacterium intermedium]|uniref:Uncharacterized protein n=1 Tax=Mycobacterium intermedium TaxID=28445 RepID=A0A1T3W314_MYCIE|nr:hypothetical protein [Mycobacterium intermedium]MCV6965368.1 hypothetical protein [Mycobacterium intermedium]OPE48747.1 hypothetical protein BV508_16650 [Mycobacterium intermedium]ORA89544.1 hypothetical protein BST27_29900 [Mycobacterium intermedium]
MLVGVLHPRLVVVLDGVLDGACEELAVAVAEFGKTLGQPVGEHHEVGVVIVLDELGVLGHHQLLEQLAEQRDGHAAGS